MAIPHESEIKHHLLRLLSEAPNGTMHCGKVYDVLAQSFPGLTPEETDRKYQNSVSKWANEVQWVREHCAMQELIERPQKRWDVGYWKLTQAGGEFVQQVRTRV